MKKQKLKKSIENFKASKTYHRLSCSQQKNLKGGGSEIIIVDDINA